MIKKITSIALFGALLFTNVAFAQEELSSPGIKPGSPLFFLDRFFEGFGNLFAFGDAAKARRAVSIAEERLAEARGLAEEEDNDNAERALELYQEKITEAGERAERAGNADAAARVAEAITRHLSVLDGVIERVPEEAKESVRMAKERSINGQLSALRALTDEDPERAVDIFAEAADNRLNALKAKVDRDNGGAEGVEEDVKEFEQYAQFGQEISVMAQGIQTGETSVEDLIKKATSHHLNVLESIRFKLPVQAQQNFQRAVNESIKVQELRPVAPIQPGAGQQTTSTPNPNVPSTRGR